MDTDVSACFLTCCSAGTWAGWSARGRDAVGLQRAGREESGLVLSLTQGEVEF